MAGYGCLDGQQDYTHVSISTDGMAFTYVIAVK